MWLLGCVAICLSLAVPSTVAQEGGGGTKEKYWELRKALLKDYDPLASPVGPTADDAVTLDVGVTILKISVEAKLHVSLPPNELRCSSRLGLRRDRDSVLKQNNFSRKDPITSDTKSNDEIGHSMWMTMWLKLAFKDERLTWDPAQYGGIEHLRVSSASVWIPDLALYSEVPSSHAFAGIMDELDHVDAIVYKDGKVLFVPPVRLGVALLKDYDPLASPVGPTADDAVTLDVGVTILKISVDEIGHSMWMTMWLKLAFKDERLTWDPAQYGGIEELRVSSASVWIPDLALYSEVPSSHAFAGIMDELDHVDAIVYKDGKVLFVPPVRLGVQCIFDYWNFPNDVQKCNMTFGSWTMSANQLKLSLGILSRHEPYNITESDGSWTIKATNTSLNSKVYECCPEEYMDVTHEFTLTRRPGTYQATLLIPVHMVVIMMVISILFAPGTILKYAIFILNTAVLLALLLVNQERMATSQRTPRIYTFMCAYIVFQTFLFLCDGFFLCIRSCRKPLPDVVIKVFRLNASDYSIAENHPLESADHPNEHNETVERKSSVQCKRQAQAEQLSCRLQGLLFVCMLIVTIIMYATTWPVPS
ncbi:unnamed protein product [Cyprideis torosa]|uniref:Neurotransmitter-gated ion-channel ligand-binding domain-containing protein n=1 Tax=Cyprideis torosa TaxID=163714 RepID=A0A7R8W583_9CRUS|nr:unnamed protein product [Cyprideis torosa]CAG0884982.1 unnamed protein product [Cyprideis torosa]